MDYPLIWAIGRLWIPVCPCCQAYLSNIESFNVVMQHKKLPESKCGRYRLLYCEDCKVPFTTKELSKQNAGNHKGYHLPEFSCDGSISPNDVRRRMHVPIIEDKEQSPTKQKISKQKTTKLLSAGSVKSIEENLAQHISLSIVKPPRFITGVYSNTMIIGNRQLCDKCRFSLEDSITYIPISKKAARCVKVPGKRCPNCGVLYVSDTIKKDIIVTLSNNPFASAYRLLKKHPNIGNDSQGNASVGLKKKKKHIVIPRADYSTEEEWQQQTTLAQYSSAILMLVYEHKDKICQYVIVNDEKEIDIDNNILHYSSKKARTLLSMALFPQSRAYLDKYEHYRFLSIVEKTTGKAITFPVIKKDIIVRTGGGYHEKNKPLAEVVNALLYSPFTHRLELVRASYDKEYNEYYMDPTIFRRFVDSFGNPGIPIRFSGHSFGSGYENLNEESILKVYGYNVSQTDGLLASERRAILTELVDLNIVTISRIVYLLGFFISTHPGDQYYCARNKWDDDRKFIANYKANPNRFIIGGRIHK